MGATAKLKVQYNSAAMGHFEKDVYIKLAGIETPKNIKITGDVLDTSAYEVYLKEQPQKNAPVKQAAKVGKS